MQLHFIAIGGSIMHSLAIALHHKGYIITGSDDEIFEPAYSELSLAGLLPINTGWDSLKIHKNLDFVILGMHARSDNPELLRALELKIPVYSFPEFIYKQTQNKKRIVVAGSHGKTSISSMLMHTFKHLDLSFDCLVGSSIKGMGQQVSLGNHTAFAIIEGDEYLSSAIDSKPKFLHYKPDYAIITGIAWDHYNVYPDFKNYLKQFQLFIESMPEDSVLVYNNTDTYLPLLVKQYGRHLRCLPYHCLNYIVQEGKNIIRYEGEAYRLAVFGRHNIENISAVIRLGEALKVNTKKMLQALTTFPGAGRRLELLAESPVTKVYYDFAHAPSKVAATVKAVKETFPEKKLIACLELHTYSSLNKSFLPQYKGSMNKADHAIVFYNPHALALKKLTLDKDDVKSGFDLKDLIIFDNSAALKNYLLSLNYRHAILLFMSSGNFDKMDLSEIATFASTKSHNT